MSRCANGHEYEGAPETAVHGEELCEHCEAIMQIEQFAPEEEQ